MTELPTPDNDFALWTAEQWARLAPDADSVTATVAIRFMRTADALSQSHARTIRPWRQHGVQTIDDFRLLGILRHVAEEGVRTQHIAEHLATGQGTVSSRVSRLERHGLVERFADPIDGRARRVRLSPGKEGLVDDIYRALVANHENFFTRLTRDEHHSLSDLLGKL